MMKDNIWPIFILHKLSEESLMTSFFYISSKESFIAEPKLLQAVKLRMSTAEVIR